MLNRIYLYAGIALAAVLAIFGIKLKAKAEGKQEQKQEQVKEVMKNVQQAKEVQTAVRKLPDADVRDKLRKRATR